MPVDTTHNSRTRSIQKTAIVPARQIRALVRAWRRLYASIHDDGYAFDVTAADEVHDCVCRLEGAAEASQGEPFQERT